MKRREPLPFYNNRGAVCCFHREGLQAVACNGADSYPVQAERIGPGARAGAEHR